MAARGFVQLGTNRYPFPVTVYPNPPTIRVDDVTVVGGALDFQIINRIGAGIQATRTTYSSTIDVFNRSVFRLGAGIRLQGDLFR